MSDFKKPSVSAESKKRKSSLIQSSDDGVDLEQSQSKRQRTPAALVAVPEYFVLTVRGHKVLFYVRLSKELSASLQRRWTSKRLVVNRTTAEKGLKDRSMYAHVIITDLTCGSPADYEREAALKHDLMTLCVNKRVFVFGVRHRIGCVKSKRMNELPTQLRAMKLIDSTRLLWDSVAVDIWSIISRVGHRIFGGVAKKTTKSTSLTVPKSVTSNTKKSDAVAAVEQLPSASVAAENPDTAAAVVSMDVAARLHRSLPCVFESFTAALGRVTEMEDLFGIWTPEYTKAVRVILVTCRRLVRGIHVGVRKEPVHSTIVKSVEVLTSNTRVLDIGGICTTACVLKQHNLLALAFHHVNKIDLKKFLGFVPGDAPSTSKNDSYAVVKMPVNTAGHVNRPALRKLLTLISRNASVKIAECMKKAARQFIGSDNLGRCPLSLQSVEDSMQASVESALTLPDGTSGSFVPLAIMAPKGWEPSTEQSRRLAEEKLRKGYDKIVADATATDSTEKDSSSK